MTQKYDSIEFTLDVGAIIITSAGKKIRHLGNGKFSTPITDELFSIGATELSAAEVPRATQNVGVLAVDALVDKNPQRGIFVVTYQDPNLPGVELAEEQKTVLSHASLPAMNYPGDGIKIESTHPWLEAALGEKA